MLHVQGIRKSFGRTVALDGVDLHVRAGEIHALIGPNGAGKTTLMSIIAGLCRPDSGTVSIDGVDALREPSRARRAMGFAPQDIGIYPSLPACDSLRLFGELAGLRGRRLKARIEEAVAVLDLEGLIDRPGRSLSGGEKRRLHTAMAILHAPVLLLLDEPTTGVDVESRTRMLEFVRKTAAERGTAVCYSTHYLHEIETLGAELAVIDGGRIIAVGSVERFINEHRASGLAVRFDGDAPNLDTDPPCERNGEELWISTPDPGTALASLIAGLGDDASRLRSVRFLQPGLEAAYLALTGRFPAGTDTAVKEEHL